MNEAPERPIFSEEAEHGVIGALLHRADLADRIGANLLPEHFFNADNAMLYSMILAQRAKGHSPDVITLSDYRAELPSGAPTLIYAAEIQRNVPGYANAMQYAKVVRERFQARKLQQAAWEISDIALSKGNISEQIANAQAMLMSLDAEDDRPDVILMSDVLPKVVDELDRANAAGQEQYEPEGVTFGLPDLDRIIKRLRPGSFTVIAGRPGTGKTVLGLNLADNIAINEGHGVLVFTLEMEGNELARRCLAAQSQVTQSVLDGSEKAADDHWPLITQGVNKIQHADYRLCEKPALPFSRIASIARYQHRVKPLKAILVDYIGLVASEPGSKLFNRAAELGVVSRGMKALAKELKVPVIALAQLNRGIESRADKTPQMSDLRDCGDIEQDADTIIMAHRDENSEDGRDGYTEIFVPKCRHGKTGRCTLMFRGEIAKFVPAIKRYGDTEEKPVRPRSAKSFINAIGKNG